ncbi:MAG: M50 family metallopeptidase [Clostridia bacterium]|nr:M50 family metallopeptidase [Clostridia bacterium]
MKKRFTVRPIVLIFLLGLILGDQTALALMTLLAAFTHEVGHLIAAKCMRIPLSRMQIDLLGARLEVQGRVLSYSEEWLLAAAGPLSSLLSAIAVAPLWSRSEWAVLFSCASLLLGLLNLLPIRTFDGGRMLESFLSARTSWQTTRVVMRGCSFLFLFLLFAFSVYLLLRADDGLSLLCFSVSLLARFFEGEIG